ncbi:hypothetical protein [Kitasatospora sp. NPDC088346]|uniref:hypothetical protein n=1 Tax=Kitasatospora sp. NPDC088346 TaxID=3364073 RepID=UPI0037F570A2
MAEFAWLVPNPPPTGSASQAAQRLLTVCGRIPLALRLVEARLTHPDRTLGTVARQLTEVSNRIAVGYALAPLARIRRLVDTPAGPAGSHSPEY